MKFRIIYPKWQKLKEQTPFFLPPHGPVVMAAALPDYVSPLFTDENVSEVDFNEEVDFVGISMMLSTQVKRGFEIASVFRQRGVKVIFGGISSMLHAEEVMLHGDSVFLGEAEGRMQEVFADFCRNALKISPIIGRLNQMLKIKGTTIYPPVVFDILDNMEEVHNYIVEINSSDFGTDVLKIFVDCTQIYDGIDKEIKDRFRAKLRIAPELCFLDKEELLKMQKAMEQRKPIKLIDNRIN